LTILFRAFSAFLDLTLTLTWGVAPGYYISRRWRWFADFCSKAAGGEEMRTPVAAEISCVAAAELSPRRGFASLG